MTKASKIRSLYYAGLSIKDIAAEVGCRPEYVRVVARQRMGGGVSHVDRRYERSSLGRETRKAAKKRIWDAGNCVAAAEVGRKAYKAALETGLDRTEARRKYNRAYSLSRYSTGYAALRDLRNDDGAARMEQPR